MERPAPDDGPASSPDPALRPVIATRHVDSGWSGGVRRIVCAVVLCASVGVPARAESRPGQWPSGPVERGASEVRLAAEGSGGKGSGQARGGGDPKGSPGPRGPGGPQPAQGEPEVRDSPLEAEEQRCVEGSAVACREAGIRWREGRGVPRDVTRAEPLLAAGCRLGDARACVHHGRMFLELEAGLQILAPEGLPSLDLGAAAEAFDLGCDLGAADACGLAGDLHLRPEAMLPDATTRGRGLEVDLPLAVQSFERGCPPEGPADLRSCVRLAELFGRGYAVRRDPDRAAFFATKACALDPKGPWCAAATKAGTTEVPSDPTASSTPPQGGNGRVDAPSTAGPGASGGRAGHRRYSEPTTDRFEAGKVAAGPGETARPRVRIDMAGRVGARWSLRPTVRPGVVAGIGSTLWHNVVGFSWETAFTADRLFPLPERRYVAYQHALGLRLALPLPIELPVPARLVVELAAGGLFGQFRPGYLAPVQWFGGARQGLGLRLSSAQERGPRQWFGFDFDVEEIGGLPGGLEVAQRLTLVIGFSGGGYGPEWGAARPWFIPVLTRP